MRAERAPVPVQLWKGWAQSRRRCGRGGRSPGADLASMSQCPVAHEPRLSATESPRQISGGGDDHQRRFCRISCRSIQSLASASLRQWSCPPAAPQRTGPSQGLATRVLCTHDQTAALGVAPPAHLRAIGVSGRSGARPGGSAVAPCAPGRMPMECVAAPPNKDSTSARVEIDVGDSSRCLTNSWHACCVAATCCVAFHNAATSCVAQRCDATHNAATCCVLPRVPDQQLWANSSERAVGSLRAAAAVRCEWRSVVAQRHCAHRMCTLMMIGGALRGACCVPCAAWHKCCGMQRRTAEPSAGRPRGSAGLAAQRQSLCCSLSHRTAPSPSRRCSVVPHLHRDWAHPAHICTGTRLVRTGTGLTPPTSAPGLRSRVAHRHRDWAHRCHICTGTGPTLATSAPGLGSPLPRLHRGCDHAWHIGTRPSHAVSALGRGPPLPHLHRDWARRCHLCPGLRPPLPHLQSDRLGVPSSIVWRPDGHARSGGGKAVRAALTTLLSILHSCRQRQGLVSAVPVQMWQVNHCAVRAAACCVVYVVCCKLLLHIARCALRAAHRTLRDCMHAALLMSRAANASNLDCRVFPLTALPVMRAVGVLDLQYRLEDLQRPSEHQTRTRGRARARARARTRSLAHSG